MKAAYDLHVRRPELPSPLRRWNGIRVIGDPPEAAVIRDNIIAAARVRMPGPSWLVIGINEQTDSTLAGVPIALADLVDNIITDVRRREPFPGNVLWGIDEEQWRHANGSATRVSPGSDGNETAHPPLPRSGQRPGAAELHL